MSRRTGTSCALLDAELMRDPPANDEPVKVGDRVTRRPVSFSDPTDKTARRMTGEVVYVHPQGRFHVVRFGEGARSVRESFPGVV